MYIEHLDVRSILRAKGNPFKKINQTVSGLNDNGIFELRTTFRPTPLYRVLGKKGFAHLTICLAKADYLTQFYRDTEETRFVVDLEGTHRRAVDDSFDPDSMTANHILEVLKNSSEQPQVMILGMDGEVSE